MTQNPIAEASQVCPRCGGRFKKPFAALSRLDNKTYICPDCGQNEAMYNFRYPSQPLPPFGESLQEAWNRG